MMISISILILSPQGHSLPGASLLRQAKRRACRPYRPPILSLMSHFDICNLLWRPVPVCGRQSNPLQFSFSCTPCTNFTARLAPSDCLVLRFRAASSVDRSLAVVSRLRAGRRAATAATTFKLYNLTARVQ